MNKESISIQSANLKATILLKGAELCSLLNTSMGVEYMWQADNAIWAKHSPILFPIVGSLKQDEYRFEHKNYTLPRHGFARDMPFEVKEQTATSLSLQLKSTAQTLINYPFAFCLIVTYTITDDRLNVQYKVINTDAKTMYFSIGAHPAFNVPLDKNLSFEDYQLRFSQNEIAPIYPLNEKGLVMLNGQAFLQNENIIPLKKSLFFKDALIFKNLESSSLSLETEKGNAKVVLTFKGFPYLGIWSKPNANFVCIEPWYGIADNETCTGELKEKEGIIALDQNKEWAAEWAIEIA